MSTLFIPRLRSLLIAMTITFSAGVVAGALAPLLTGRGAIYATAGLAISVLAYCAEGRLQWQKKQPGTRDVSEFEFWSARLTLLLGLATIGLQFVIADYRSTVPPEIRLAYDVRNAFGYSGAVCWLVSRLHKTRMVKERLDREKEEAEVQAEVLLSAQSERQRPAIHRSGH